VSVLAVFWSFETAESIRGGGGVVATACSPNSQEVASVRSAVQSQKQKLFQPCFAHIDSIMREHANIITLRLTQTGSLRS
jgi:hypothetical protein